MTLVIDKKGQLWKIDDWGHYVYQGLTGSAPVDATVIQAEFDDGFTATEEDFATAFGTRNYTMRVSAQSTTYELTITELTSLMAKELNVAENRITLRFKDREVGDDRFGTPHHETYAIEVVVTGPTPEGLKTDTHE